MSNENATTPAADDERAAFETWVHKRGLGLDLTRCAPPEDQFYVDEATHAAWMAWDARAHREAAPANAQAARSERRAVAFGHVAATQCIAMQAAVIDAQLQSPKAGMRWILNTLFGPGLLPDLEQARAMGGAQAWFDKHADEESERFAQVQQRLADTAPNAALQAAGQRLEMAEICCGNFDSCTRMCVPRAEHWRQRWADEVAQREHEVAELQRLLAAALRQQEQQPLEHAAERFLADVRAELLKARAKFPGDRIMVIALAEEFGELAKAVLDESAERVRKEAVQTAVMAARVAIDGDGSVREWRAAKGLDVLGAPAQGGANHA